MLCPFKQIENKIKVLYELEIINSSKIGID